MIWIKNTLICSFRIFCSIAVLLGAVTRASAQEKSVAIHVLNGKNGKPIANEDLLPFQGTTEQEVREQRSFKEIRTDASGVGIFPLIDQSILFVQGSADGYVLCQKDPKHNTYSVEEIKRVGANAENTCGSILRKNTHNEFTLYIRRATLWEKIRDNFWLVAPRINPRV